MPRKAVIQRERRVFEDLFSVDEFVVSHEQINGTMSADQKRLVFERGDSVAALLLDLDAESVVLVEQFKVATLIGRRRDEPKSTDGWILETIAGTVDAGETPEAAVIRETEEETGYEIRRPKLVSQFFSSPGGTSERVFLYFAEVRKSDRLKNGGGIGNEDIKVVHLTLDDLFDRLAKGAIEDPKLLVAAYWLQDQAISHDDRKRLVDTYWGRSTAGAQSASGPVSAPVSRPDPLPFSNVRYALNSKKDLLLGYKTGPIDGVEGVSVWVNSENTDMMMDRFLGKSISASIRYLGANRDDNGNVVEDTIEEALRSAVGQRGYVRIGAVLVTESGTLRISHNVRRIFHVASVEGGGPGKGVKADPTKLAHCVGNVLKRVDEENNRWWNTWLGKERFESILIPLLGAGDGGVPAKDVAERIIPAALQYFQHTDAPTLKEIYFLAYTLRDRSACDQVLERFLSDGTLVRVSEG